MFIVMGATGHVGSACVKALLDAGEPVTAIVRDAAKGGELKAQGAKVAVADINDPASLRAAFRLGRRAFLLNPPADPSGDTDRTERETIAGILAALDGSGLEKVVAQSTYGAQAGERLGDLSTLWTLEEGLRAQAIPATIQRAAYYYINWDDQLPSIRETGVLHTMYPADLAIPMVSPIDLGRTAADLLREPEQQDGITCTEGPEHLSSNDVARVFAGVLGQDVAVEVTPRDKWEESFRALGFSDAAADAFTNMMAVSVDGGFDVPENPRRGTVTLKAHVEALVEAQSGN